MAQLAKLIYLDVIVRTSWFPALVGLSIALWSGVGVLDWRTWAAFITGLVGMLVIQGMYEHALDYLRDKGGYSAFRQDVKKPLVAKKALKYSVIIAAILALIIVFCERWWLLLFGVLAFRTAKIYVETHNEFYAVFGFMLSYTVGYFSATNYPTLPWLIGLLIVAFIYKASLAMYRLDDYTSGEISSTETLIQYYRNTMRYMLHSIPLLIIVLIFSLKLSYSVEKLAPWNYMLWLIGFSSICYVLVKYRSGNVVREIPIWGIGLAVMFSDAISALLLNNMLSLLKMAIAYTIWWLIFIQFWLSRHAMCNCLKCPLNSLLPMKEKRPK